VSEETSFIDWRKRERAMANEDPAERRSRKGIVLGVVLVAVVALAVVAVFLVK
jgi:hypothetical protein